jgi:hypothetical protein
MGLRYGQGVTLIGNDWKLFEKFVKQKWGNELKAAVEKATARSAMWVLSQIRQKVHDKGYELNADSTAIRKGHKSADEATPLIESGTMIRDTLLTKQIKTWTWEVGAIADKYSPRTNKPYKEIIEIIHDGKTYSYKTKTGKTVTIRIPARPFLRTVFEDVKVHAHIRSEWSKAIERVLKKHGKL